MLWKKHQQLGRGSYGTVYFAGVPNSPKLTAAVKTAKLQKSSSLVKEAEILKQFIGDPYIIQAYGEDTSFEENQEWVYNLFMEYAPEGSLQDLISRYNGTMPEDLVAYYSYMILRGLSRIHGEGLAHCDIKPSNILVFKTLKNSHHLKLADFGIAKYVREIETRRFRGTPAYASPESVAYGLHGTATDIWSFGCTVIEMLTAGRLVFEDISIGNIFNVIDQHGPPQIPRNSSGICRDFLKRCFDINPADRWTAEMLLNHPFIQMNTLRLLVPPGFEPKVLAPMNNPFGSWICTEGLFSSASTPAAAAKQLYELFPEEKNDTQRRDDQINGGGDFSLLFEYPFVDLIDNLLAC